MSAEENETRQPIGYRVTYAHAFGYRAKIDFRDKALAEFWHGMAC